MAMTVLVPLDGSDKDGRALTAVAAVAELSGGNIHLLRVLDTPVDSITTRGQVMGVAHALRETRSNMEQEAAQQAQQLADTTGRRATSEVIEGFDVAQVILDRANDPAIEFVVMATRAAGALGRALRGSVADRVMRESTRPVFLIPPALPGTAADIRLQRVLIPLDGSGQAMAAIEALLTWERVGELDIQLVEVIATGVIDEPGDQGIDPALVSHIAHAQTEAEQRLHEIAASMRQRGARAVQVRVTQAADAAAAINQMAREAEIDLIAMSTRGRGGMERLVLGSVAEGVVRGSDVPVLLIR